MEEFQNTGNKRVNKYEAICRIEQVYHATYSPNMADFDALEQLLVCESLAETEQEALKNDDVNVRWNGNGGYKNVANEELNWYKSELIIKLKFCKKETPEYEVASLLERTFAYWPYDKKDHWLKIAQFYNPRVLNWVMSETVKKYLRGGIIKSPPAILHIFLNLEQKKLNLENNE